jgi:quercetin dioxygenase-like cupin family protein
MTPRGFAPPRSRFLLLTVAAVALAAPVLAQDDAAPALGRTELAQATLPSVVETPLHFRLLKVSLGDGETARYTATDGLIYQLSGAQTVTVGERTSVLSAGEGAYVDGGLPATFEAAAGEASVFLYFLLVAAADAELPDGSGAEVSEIFTGAEPLPGLSDGPYTFDLTLVTFPPNYPINDPHYRTGGALYYVASGSGEFTAAGGVEQKPAGSVILEPNGLVHQWSNPHDSATTVVVANIAPAGGPAIVFGTP